MTEASATPQAAVTPQAGERRQVERRKHPRYPVSGGAGLRQQGVDSRIWARLTDISLGGCYLEIMSPLPALGLFVVAGFVARLGQSAGAQAGVGVPAARPGSEGSGRKRQAERNPRRDSTSRSARAQSSSA